LQHGSIILEGDQGIIAQLGGPTPSPPATLTGLLGGPPERKRLDAVLRSAFEARFSGEWSLSRLTTEELSALETLETKYLDPEWTWRR